MRLLDRMAIQQGRQSTKETLHVFFTAHTRLDSKGDLRDDWNTSPDSYPLGSYFLDSVVDRPASIGEVA